MRDDKTAILMILDMSGSMQLLTADTVGGFNRFVEDQKKEPGEAVVTLVLFNNSYEKVWTKDLKDVVDLDSKTYRPRGGTALLDAVGMGIDNLGVDLDAMPEDEKPGKVIVVIMTDGEENSSHEYSATRVKEMVEHQKKTFSWEFIFLGANIDAFAAGASMGILKSHAANYSGTSKGTSQAYEIASRSVGSFRKGGSGKIN